MAGGVGPLLASRQRWGWGAGVGAAGNWHAGVGGGVGGGAAAGWSGEGEAMAASERRVAFSAHFVTAKPGAPAGATRRVRARVPPPVACLPAVLPAQLVWPASAAV